MQKFLIVAISLKNSLDRRKNCKSYLDKYNYDWIFFDAIDGKKIENYPPEYNEKKVKKLLGFDMTLTEIAVRFSHLEVWKKSLALNIPILVLEDDFTFEHNIDECIKFAFKYYDSWEVLRLQALFESNFEILKEEKNIKLVKNLSDPLGCTAYFVKPTSAKTLIEHSHNFFEPIDHFLEHSSYHGLNFLAIKPYPVDITGEPPTVFGRDDRKPIRGLRKLNRSINRFIDRLISKKPWFN